MERYPVDIPGMPQAGRVGISLPKEASRGGQERNGWVEGVGRHGSQERETGEEAAQTKESIPRGYLAGDYAKGDDGPGMALVH